LISEFPNNTEFTLGQILVLIDDDMVEPLEIEFRFRLQVAIQAIDDLCS